MRRNHRVTADTSFIVKATVSIGQLATHLNLTNDITLTPIKYNRTTGLELLFNFVWAMLSVSLGFLWIGGLRHVPARTKRLDTRVQLLALAILIVVLLPVISMTDDMQAMSTAEIEHVTRRADLLPSAEQPLDIIASLDVRLFPNRLFFDLPIFARVEPSIENLRRQYGSFRQLANRPPPVPA